MLRVAVTGGIACGKSLVGSFFAAEGLPVCDADELGHRMLRRGSPVYGEVVREFGPDIVGPDGEIDRRALGRRAFARADRLEALHRLVHPAVRGGWESWLAEQRAPAAAVLIPLLYEIGDQGNWDRVVCVGAPLPEQLARMRARGWTEEEIEERLRAQWPVFEKMDRADHVIYNAGSVGLLQEQTRRIVKEIVEGEHVRQWQ